MPKNTNILMVRHAEKPEDNNDTGLAVPGQARANAYITYFQNFAMGSKAVRLRFLFATAQSSESNRPVLTITPLSKALGLDINSKHADKEYLKVAADILQDPKYDNSDILICWHHGKILQLAEALGVDRGKLPPSSTWPAVPWLENVFGWLLQLCFDGHGSLIPEQNICINQKLMYDDYGKNPPAGN
jgi:hypothetical protein